MPRRGAPTLAGEGLQHCDGQSQVLATAHPNCRAYDPAFAYEMGVIVRDGIQRMYGDDPEDCFYYLTLYNENYPMPAMPVGVEDGIVKGLYRFRTAPEGEYAHRAQIVASGTGMLAALDTQRMLADEWDVGTDVWSATSWKLLREEALSVERWNRLHPAQRPACPTSPSRSRDSEGPIVAVSDFMKAMPDGVARFVPRPLVVLGTDGYGFSDTRVALRRHFEVDAPNVVIAALHGLSQTDAVKDEVVHEAITRYDLSPDKIDPRLA